MLVAFVQSGRYAGVEDCSSKLAKDMALAASSFGKKSAPIEPKAFMMQCAVDGMKNDLHEGAAEYVKKVEGFVQNLLNAASAGGSLDAKKLVSAVGEMNVNELLVSIRELAAGDECVVDEPYEQPVAVFASSRIIQHRITIHSECAIFTNIHATTEKGSIIGNT